MTKIHERIIRTGNSQASSGAVPIGEQLGLVPARGRVAGVIELANSIGPRRRGGRDPGVPTVFTHHEITGRLRIGHTADFHNPATPIIVREADDVRPGPDGTGYAEGRCRSCVASPYLARGDAETMLILQHQPGCPELAQLLALAGGAR